LLVEATLFLSHLDILNNPLYPFVFFQLVVLVDPKNLSEQFRVIIKAPIFQRLIGITFHLENKNRDFLKRTITITIKNPVKLLHLKGISPRVSLTS